MWKLLSTSCLKIQLSVPCSNFLPSLPNDICCTKSMQDLPRLVIAIKTLFKPLLGISLLQLNLLHSFSVIIFLRAFSFMTTSHRKKCWPFAFGMYLCDCWRQTKMACLHSLTCHVFNSINPCSLDWFHWLKLMSTAWPTQQLLGNPELWTAWTSNFCNNYFSLRHFQNYM